ncbi:MAG TPA: TonB family protein [Burkholderiales bacterium]|nr:TonB family protein [Burkholderiales bacterium]
MRASGRALHFFLGASALAHAAAIAVLPGAPFESAFTVPSVMEVTILQPEPLPVAVLDIPPAPLPHTAPAPPAATERPRPGNARKAERQQPDPLFAAPGREPRAEASPAVTSGLPEVPAPAPDAGRKIEPAIEPETQPARAPVTPPSLAATYLSNPPPGYPQAARRAGEQGTVTLRVLVRRDGSPASVEVESSSGSRRLDAAARDAVSGWRFVPARRGADPIESWVRVPIVFRLEGAS